MKKITVWLMMALLAVPAISFAAKAQPVEQPEEDYAVTASADFMSAYVSKGVVGNDEPVFQPAISVEAPYGFAFSLWANMNLTDNECAWDPDTAGKWSEFDLGLSWTTPWEGPAYLTIGGTYFTYPQARGDVIIADEAEEADAIAPAEGNYEVYVAVGGNVILNPELGFYHDTRSSEDWYLLGSIGHSLALTDLLSLDLGASIVFSGRDYAARNFGSSEGAAFSNAQIDAALNFALTESTTLYVKGSFSSLLDSDIRDAVDADDSIPELDYFVGGAGVSYTF